MVATVVAAVTNLVLNYVFILYFGYIAAGYTTLISNLVLTFMHYRNTRVIEKERIYDPKFSLLSVIFVVAGCLACNLLYGLAVIRYLLIAVLFVCMFIKRRTLIQSLVDMKV